MSTDASPVADTVALIDELALVDHHVHGASRADLSARALSDHVTESNRPTPDWMSPLDSSVGFALRRWCAPILDLEPHASPAEYAARRLELGSGEVNHRFLRASRLSHLLVDTGHQSGEVLGPAEMAQVSGADAREVVRLESVAEEVALSGTTASDFAERFAERLARRCHRAVATKTVIAYRHGLDFDPEPPSRREVAAAAGRWLAQVSGGAPARLTDPVLLRHAVWTGVETSLPLQVHTGFGDPDLRLESANPARLTGFIERAEDRCPAIMLLHCYPYHREAAYLSHAYPHVFADVGLAITYLGAAAYSVVSELFELAPFAKILYSSDAWGPAELHYLGAAQWRRALGRLLAERVAGGDWSASDARRVARMVGRDNALRVYRLDEAPQ